MIKTTAKLIKKIKLTKNVFSFNLECLEIANSSKAGQFINILVEGFMLRRPISICEITKNGIRIVFSIRGKGTKKMSTWQEGKEIDIIAPLGNGFSTSTEKDSILVVGGGLGVAPLLEVFKNNSKKIALLGFNNDEDVILKEDFEKYGKTIIYTKEGGEFEKGLVTKDIEKIIKQEKINKIKACGPERMLDAIKDIAKEKKIHCEISLEERMGCGFGACLCCQKTIEKNGEKMSFHVCKDGPVFVV